MAGLKADAWREKVEREKREAERRLREEIRRMEEAKRLEEVKRIGVAMVVQEGANGHGVRGSRGSNRPRPQGLYAEPALPV